MIRNIIFIFILLIIFNLLWTVINLESSPLIQLSNKILTCDTDEWALRGQIGDIMSGHFSALAFLAVALSIIFQYEANKQMRESIKKQEKAIELQANSIEQQNKALEVQSKALEAQMEELKASREESKKQTEEFFIQNLNTKLDRYYKLVDFNLDLIMGETIDVKMKIINILDKDSKDYNEKDANSQIRISYKVFIILEHIYKEIKSLESNPHYKMFLNEFRIKIHTNFFIETLCINSSKEQKETYSFLKEYDYHFAFKQKTTEADS